MTPELKSRILYGSLAGAAVLFIFGVSFLPSVGAAVTGGLAAIFFAAVAWEASSMLVRSDYFKSAAIGCLLLILFVGFERSPQLALTLTLLVLSLILVSFSALSQLTEEPIKSFQFILAALLIIGGGACATFLFLVPQGNIWIFISILTVVISDSVAYFAGSYLKGPKLAPTISPNKTWSGAVSALIVGSLFSALLIHALLSSSFLISILIGILIVVAGIITDLAQSRIKRIAGVKDSGTLLGAHGGLFDRVDSHLGAFIIAAIGNLILS